MHIKIVPFGLVCVNILDYPLYLLHFCWCINYQVCLSTKILYIGKYKIFFFKNHAENEPGRLVPDLSLFFKKALFEVNAIGLQLSFNQFR